MIITEMFAVPGRVTDKYSQGCNNWLKPKSKMCATGAADLIYILNWDIQKETQPVQNNCLLP
jgi:DNA processing protein